MKKSYSVWDIEKLVEEVKKDFPGAEIHLDKELAFYHFYIPEIEEDIKKYTIRFRPGCIRLPSGIVAGSRSTGFVPCYETDPSDKAYRKEVGHIRVTDVLVSTVKDFSAEDARLDGFKNKREMVKRVSEIYNYKLKPDDYISMYRLDRLFRKK
ncbi:MAG: ASCH domain-containing protein [Nanoarchaeota archaeon]|nr:ASCH domain-containing protein [Nanoarchaeota archaeon]